MKKLIILMLFIFSLVSVSAVDVTDTPPVTLTEDQAGGNAIGPVFQPTLDIEFKYATIATGDDGHTCNLYYNSNYSLIATASITSLNCSFASNPFLLSSERYALEIVHTSSIKLDLSVSYPMLLTNIDILTASNSGGNTSAAYWSVESITTGPPPTPPVANLTIDDINLINNTFTNSSTLNIALNISNSSTNNLINTTLFLSNGTSIQIGTNTQNVSFNLTGISEGVLNLWGNSSNNETSVGFGNFTYTFDFTDPVIQKIGNISEDSFSVNFSLIYNVTDALSGLNSCSINITELSNVTTPDNFLINCTDTQTFNTAGDHNAFVLATDNAGNTATFTENFTINPIITIFFNDTSNGTIQLTYDATIFHPDGRETIPIINADGSINLSPVNNDSLDLGVHTIQFEKLGFATENFTTNVTDTSGNETIIFNVTRSKIILSIFDRETLSLISPSTTTITLSGPSGFLDTTTSGLINISDINFLAGDYQIVAENALYETETIFFTYSNQEDLNLDIFMLNSSASDLGSITLIVKNTLSQLIPQANCAALEWRANESAFVSVAQGQTNVNGETILNIEINTKIYQFSCTKLGFTTTTNSQIIQVDLSSLNIILNDIILIPTTLFPNLLTSLTNSTINATHQLITYTFTDSDGLTTQGCVNVFEVNGNRQTFDSSTCTSASTGTVLVTLNINRTSTILVEGVLTTPEITNFVTDKLTFKGNNDISIQLAKYGLDILIPTIFMLLGISLGVLMSSEEIAGIAAAVMTWLAVALVPGVISTSIATFISVLVGLILWGGFKQK